MLKKKKKLNDEDQCHLKCESGSGATVGAWKSQFKSHQHVRINELIRVVSIDIGKVKGLSPAWHTNRADLLKGGGSSRGD